MSESITQLSPNNNMTTTLDNIFVVEGPSHLLPNNFNPNSKGRNYSCVHWYCSIKAQGACCSCNKQTCCLYCATDYMGWEDKERNICWGCFDIYINPQYCSPDEKYSGDYQDSDSDSDSS